MYMVILGTLLLALKIAGVGPTANWSWWVVLAPFGLALLWWAWADGTGWTKRREIEKMHEKKRARRERNMAALGMGSRDPRAASGPKGGYRDLQAQKIEAERDEIRRKNREVMSRSTRPGSLDTKEPTRRDSVF